MDKLKNIRVIDARVNNLKSINVEIEFGKLTVCAGPSGSGKSSFAFETLIKRECCQIDNYPDSVKFVTQRMAKTSEKLAEIRNLAGVKDSLIVMDEPLAGTTSKEAVEYSKIIKELSLHNAVVVVEHRSEILDVADVVLAFGPGSGPQGGELVGVMSGREYIESLPVVTVERIANVSNKRLSALYSDFAGIKNYEVSFRINMVTSVTGPSGCGKSTYLEAVYRALDKSAGASERRGNLVEVKNKAYIRRPHIIDASPVAKNSKSTVATYYGVSKFLREEAIDITIGEAMDAYKDDKLVTRRLQHLVDIGLDYLKLNQSSFSLSGGECQRIKLAKLLCKKLGDRSVYIFDNPVRGLGEVNVEKVMMMFDELVKRNNTVLIAENDPSALKFVDEVIEL